MNKENTCPEVCCKCNLLMADCVCCDPVSDMAMGCVVKPGLSRIIGGKNYTRDTVIKFRFPTFGDVVNLQVGRAAYWLGNKSTPRPVGHWYTLHVSLRDRQLTITALEPSEVIDLLLGYADADETPTEHSKVFRQMASNYGDYLRGFK